MPLPRPSLITLMLSTLLAATLVVGCAATAQTTTDSSQVTDDSSVASGEETENVAVDELAPQAMVAQVQILSDEIRSLRDQVEILETELDTTKQRQKDLYDDLDARLRKFERGGSSNTSVSESDAGESDSAPSSGADQTTEILPAETADTGEETTQVDQAVEAVDPEVIREVYDNAFRTLRQGKYEDAIIEFNALIQNYPQSELVDDALYWIAEANYVTKKFDIALMGFEQITRDYPDNRRAAEAMLKIGYIYYDQQDFEQAQNYLTEVIERYPASRSAFSANRRLNKMKRDGNL